MRITIPASLLLASTARTSNAFSTLSFTDRAASHESPVVLKSTNGDSETSATTTLDRRTALSKGFGAVLATGLVATSSTQPANALVKGVAPPPKKSVGDKPKCTNVEECQAMAEIKAAEERAIEESGPPPLVTKGGIKYRDIEEGSTTLDSDGNDVSLTAKDGDDVDVYFKVLKLGKRSYDGLSGEGTVVFSRGYGLEDDETKAGQKAFTTSIGGFSNIAALNEALVGMKPNGLRRFAILPQKGWEKATAACDGGPGGGGAGGDIRTDYVVVPTATMVQQEACLDTNKQPFPSTYAQQRRMAQRFDQSLIMEVQLVSINNRSK
jgi:hypothetical protein